MPSDTATIPALAHIIGAAEQTVRGWTSRAGFPAPAAGQKWSRDDPLRWDVDLVGGWLDGCAAALELRFAERQLAREQAQHQRERREAERWTQIGKAIDMIEAGTSIQDAADTLGMRYWQLRKQLANAGFDAPSLGRRPQHTLDDCLDAARSAAGWAHPRHLSEARYKAWRNTQQPDAPATTSLHRIMGVMSWTEVLWAAGITSAPTAGTPGNLPAMKRRHTDAEMIDALRMSGAATVHDYIEWRRGHPGRPGARTIIGRFGSWAKARQATTDPSGPKGEAR